ncbi:histidine kinase dimerization/phospho-acceptor domain-containing protein [Abyssogena phaseoliformis symbiont]|uniref:histidine kinase dimerization/phospho-acceptor domain-containing protein n=1 Tax=Abyssogena phaseoliformis symbiont TaxID=596095 RepID=UPI0019164E63|nr:histidine kinase dimerization/phospho-acceptor domain-containing protein [Abyssogena phaseoliformis symbiont]
MRTPLTVISGYLEMMQDSHLLPETLFKAVQSSYEQSERMGNIIEDLLTLSRLESTKLAHEASTGINMEKVINHICSDEGDLIITKIPSKALILGIETEIISLCSNLIFNAKRHMPDGTKIIVSWR